MVGTKQEILNYLEDFDEKVVFEVKVKKHKRSLDANAYMWVLIGKLAKSLSSTDDEVYELMLYKYGQSEIVSVLSTIDVSKYFSHYVIVGESRIKGKMFKHYKVIRGTSDYTREEMVHFIERSYK